MPTRPRLISSIPFWALLAASLATVGAGAYILTDRLGSMTTVLTDGTATPADVYVGQSVAVAGAVVLGAGIVGILFTLAVAALATLRPVEVVEPVELDIEADEVEAEPAVEAPAEAPAAEPATPDTDAEPVTR